MTNPIDIRPEHLAIVKQILADTLPPESKCWVFGSRAKWTAKDSSDLDIAIDAGKALTKQQSFSLSDAFEESDLPYKVDVVDLHNVSESFHAVIERDKVPLPEWLEVKLGECVDITSSKRIFANEYVPFGVPFYRGKEVIEKAKGNNISTELFITEQRYDEIKKKFGAPKAGDMLLTSVGTLGVPYVVQQNEKFYFKDGNLTWFRNFRNLHNEYLRYWLLSSTGKEEIKKITIGSTQQALTINALSGLKITLPPLPEQQAIAGVLSALDEKIELNRRMNATLEAMARALFKSWFVDFDPVRAKMEGRTPDGLSADIAALFPDTLAHSPLGEIPKGWEAGSLGALAANKKQTVRPDNISEGASYIALEHMPQKSIALSDWGSSDNIASAKSEFSKGDFLFGKLRPYFHKVGIAPLGGVCSTDIVVIAPKFIEAYSYVICCISQNEYVDYTNQRSAGTKMPRTNWKDMAAYELAIPPKALLKAFNEICRPSFDKIIENIHEVRTLSHLRDTLLPKLISGQLRVTNAASSIKEAV